VETGAVIGVVAFICMALLAVLVAVIALGQLAITRSREVEA